MKLAPLGLSETKDQRSDSNNPSDPVLITAWPATGPVDVEVCCWLRRCDVLSPSEHRPGLRM